MGLSSVFEELRRGLGQMMRECEQIAVALSTTA